MNEVVANPQALYRFFNTEGALLYIGISLNPGARWKQHRADKPWWTEVATIKVEHHGDREEAQDAERYNIVHNHTHRRGRHPCIAGSSRLPDELYLMVACEPPCCSRGSAPRPIYECCGDGIWTRVVA